MIPADMIRAMSSELLQIIKHAQINREAKTAGALGVSLPGAKRPVPVPRVNLPAAKVV